MKKMIYVLMVVVMTLAVNAQIIGTPILDVTLENQDPDPAEPGDFVDLKFTVVNTGNGAATEAEFELVPTSPFRLFPGEEAIKEISVIRRTDEFDLEKNIVNFRFRLLVDKNAVEGLYELEMRYRTKELSNWQKIEPFNVRIETSNPLLVIDEFYTEPSRIEPGEVANLYMRVKNVGNTGLKDISLNCDLDSLTFFSPVSISSERVIQRLGPGEETIVSFDVIPDAQTPLKGYSVPVNIEFKDESENSYKKNNTISFLVDSKPRYDLSIEDTTITAARKPGSVVISLSNRGTGNINYANLELLEDEKYVVLSKSEEYLGNLESDDFETAQFEVYAKEADGSLPLKVKLTFSDDYNRLYEEELTVPLRLFSKKEAKLYGLEQGGSGFTTILIGLVVVGAAGYYWYKKRKRK